MQLRSLTFLAVAVMLAAAGCSSSSSSAAAPPAAKTTTRPATVTGTERITGKVTGHAAVVSSAPTYPLTFSGPINTTGTFTPPNSNAVHQSGVFKTADGNLVVSATVYGQNNQPKSLGNCLYSIPIRAAYVVNGAASTGKFEGASGHGTVNVANRFYVPKLANGHCNLSQNVQPLAAGAVSTFAGSGPLTVKG